MYYCFLARGFEEIEAITTVDMLRRAGIPVQTVGVSSVNSDKITGAHQITVTTDLRLSQVKDKEIEGVILPGGMPGTINLERSRSVNKIIDYCVQNNLYIFAICAAPQILGHKGILNGKKATCYPGFESELTGAILCDEKVVKDGKVITCKGAGATVDFAAAIIAELKGEEAARKLKESMQCM